jgi:glycosyltransferase involved in cell wall biosynthesis
MARNSTPLVSIVTPSLNQGRYIGETIMSVRHQTYPVIEHIIMDGGSTDSTIAVVQKYSTPGNIIWFSKRDAGQYDAVNKGWAEAHGDIFGWINADDIYMKDTVE